jgi:hypothetical protein
MICSPQWLQPGNPSTLKPADQHFGADKMAYRIPPISNSRVEYSLLIHFSASVPRHILFRDPAATADIKRRVGILKQRRRIGEIPGSER